MAKIVIIGVGASQHDFLEKVHKQIPDAKCIHIDFGKYNREHSSGIIHYDLIENSKTAQLIFKSFYPGTAIHMIKDKYSEIVGEQAEIIKKLID